MDKLTIISGVLFVASEVFAVASLLHADWINTGTDAGAITLGLTGQCQTIYGRSRVCFMPNLPTEWVVTIFFLAAGIISLSVTCLFVAASRWYSSTLMYARWAAFLAISCLCYVGVLFPIGFRQIEIGGEAFKLPDLWRLGNSYKLLWVFAVIFACSGWGILLVSVRVWMINR